MKEEHNSLMGHLVLIATKKTEGGVPVNYEESTTVSILVKHRTSK
jgi:hypothetical protein